jgi:hypothetical protein
MAIRLPSRRQILASGAATALLRPFIDCIEARADGPAIKPCFLTMTKAQAQYGGANGAAAVDQWMPRMEDGKLKLSNILSTFESVKEYMTVVVGLDVAGPKDWHFSIPNLFTGSRRGGNLSSATGESIDGYVARRIGGIEPLVLNPTWGIGSANPYDVPTWVQSPTGAIVRKNAYSNPLTLFKDLFGGVKLPEPSPANAADAAQRKAAYEAAVARTRTSILDAIRADAARIKARAGAEHRAQIDAALGGVREIEARLVGTNGTPSQELSSACAPPKEPVVGGRAVDSEANLRRVWQGLIDVTLAAMRCGLPKARVVSFGFLNHECQSYRPMRIRAEFAHPRHGDTPYHFEYTHHFGFPQYSQHEAFLHSFYASLLSGMKAIPSGGSNLLQQSLGMYATCMSHNHSNVGHSFLVFGNAGGRVRSNRILTFGDPKTRQATGKPHNDLLVSMLQGFGYGDVKTFGSPDLVKTNGLPGFL